MAILTNPAASVRLVPAEQVARPEGEQIAYYLRVPRVSDRAAYRHALQVAGGRLHSEADLYAAMRDGVELMLSDDADAERRAWCLDRIDEQLAKIAAFQDRVRAGELSSSNPDELVREYLAAFTPAPELKEIELAVANGFGHYASMCADRAVYPEIRGAVAARLFLDGWEGLTRGGEPVPFVKRRDGLVSDSLLASVPTAHLIEIGARVEGMLEPSDDMKKN